jgi:hypothetical protein
MMSRAAVPLLLLLVAPAAVGAQQHIDRRLPIQRDANIRIFNLAGATHVTGWDRDSIAVTSVLPRGAGQFFIGGAGAGAKLGVLSDSLNAVPVTLDVRVPHGARVWIKSASAGVTVSGVDGEVDVSSVDGDISVDGVPSRLTAEAMDGNIDLTTRAAYTRAKTAGGSITLHGGGGDVLASSVSGTIRYLGAHKVLIGRLESVTGSVTFGGTVMRGGTLSIETHDGAVSLALPADQLADFTLTTFGGTVRNAIRPMAPRMPKGKPVTFSTGPNGAEIMVRTFKGDVSLSPM